MSLLASIPAPTRDLVAPEPAAAPIVAPSRIVADVPPYGQRKGFVPRKLEHYGEGERAEQLARSAPRLPHAPPCSRSLAPALALQAAPIPRSTWPSTRSI